MLYYNNNFHLFVIISTILYYFLIKKSRSKIDSNFLFLLNVIYLPVILYIFAYVYSNTKFFRLTDDLSSEVSMYPSSVDI